jgi:hypothetical protein
MHINATAVNSEIIEDDIFFSRFRRYRELIAFSPAEGKNTVDINSGLTKTDMSV